MAGYVTPRNLDISLNFGPYAPEWVDVLKDWSESFTTDGYSVFDLRRQTPGKSTPAKAALSMSPTMKGVTP